VAAGRSLCLCAYGACADAQAAAKEQERAVAALAEAARGGEAGVLRSRAMATRGDAVAAAELRTQLEVSSVLCVCVPMYTPVVMPVCVCVCVCVWHALMPGAGWGTAVLSKCSGRPP
jgi:hypothetical protein